MSHDTISRREALIGLAALFSGSALYGLAPAGKASALPRPPTAPRNPEFLDLSKVITGHDDLDPVTATRIETALRRIHPHFDKYTQALAAMIVPGMEAPALLAAGTSDELRDTALAIVGAWYTGTIGKGPNAQVVSYYQALMYKPVSDAQEIPTYCTHGEQWWLHPPPAVGVSPPPASAPAPVQTKGQQQ